MGLANWLTLLRIVLIPVFVTLLVYRRPTGAFIVFCLASLTDLLDGYVARQHGTTSRLGAFLDPLADKLLLMAAFVTLTYLKVIPFWITVVVVSRDVILSLGVVVIHVSGGTVLPVPTRLGKLSTVLQMATVLAAMLSFYFELPVAPKVVGAIAVVLTIGSGLQYLVQGLRQLNPPAAAPGVRGGRGPSGDPVGMEQVTPATSAREDDGA
jgi:cardiolipin synthase (CMP-forming)